MTRAIVDAKSDVATNKCRTSIVERLNSMPELSLLALSSDIVVEHFISDDVPDIFLRPGCFRQRSSEYRGQRAPRGTELRPDSHQRLARSHRASGTATRGAQDRGYPLEMICALRLASEAERCPDTENNSHRRERRRGIGRQNRSRGMENELDIWLHREVSVKLHLPVGFN